VQEWIQGLQMVSDSPLADDARALTREMDAEIAGLYPGYEIGGMDAADFELSRGYFVIAREADQALGCGGFRPLDMQCVEMKRIFVREASRRRGVARQILRHLESEVRRREFKMIVLETGCDNSAAIAMYEAEGYFRIPGFRGQVGIPVSRCYAKRCDFAGAGGLYSSGPDSCILPER
jgi:GNAT superfamily N-acetyltransferase